MFDIVEVWNPVCCHGNKTVKLILWSTVSRIQTLPIQIGRDIFFIIFDQNSFECMTSPLGCFASQATCLCFKMASIRKDANFVVDFQAILRILESLFAFFFFSCKTSQNVNILQQFTCGKFKVSKECEAIEALCFALSQFYHLRNELR